MPQFTGFPKVPIRGPKPFPLVGSFANILRFFGNPVGRMLALSREFGNIAAVSDGNPALICAFGAELNREVLTKSAIFQHDTDFPYKTPPGSALATISRMIVFLNGDLHRRHRKLMQPAFAKASLDGYGSDIVRITQEVLTTWPVGQTADLAILLRQLTVSIVLRCLYGLNPGKQADELGAIITQMLDVIASPAAIAFPFQIPGTPFRKLSMLAERLVKKLGLIIEEKRRQSTGQRDALALLIHAHDEDGSTLSDDELLGEALVLFAAGYDTSTQSLTWTLFLLAYYPKILADVMDEFDGELRGSAPTAEQVPRLVLLDRIVKESMRILPAASLLHIRVCASEVPLGPYLLPKGANVVLSPFMTHRDPELYPQPTRFRPERWERMSPTVYEYLPFGAGPRVCLGMGLASLSLRLMLPMILQRYRLSLVAGANISYKVTGITIAPKFGLPMHILPQDRNFPRPPPLQGNLHTIVDLS